MIIVYHNSLQSYHISSRKNAIIFYYDIVSLRYISIILFLSPFTALLAEERKRRSQLTYDYF